MAGGQGGQRGINVDGMVAQDLLEGLDASAEEVDVGLGRRLAAVLTSCVLAFLATAETSSACWASTVTLDVRKSSC